jgi:hypothetical protein
MDQEGNSVELKDDEDEAPNNHRGMDDDFTYVSSEKEYENHGYTTGTMAEDGTVTEDTPEFDEGDLSIESSAGEEE